MSEKIRKTEDGRRKVSGPMCSRTEWQICIHLNGEKTSNCLIFGLFCSFSSSGLGSWVAIVMMIISVNKKPIQNSFIDLIIVKMLSPLMLYYDKIQCNISISSWIISHFDLFTKHKKEWICLKLNATVAQQVQELPPPETLFLSTFNMLIFWASG